jgi:2-oxo-3-hexenedioate decarboxylase/2-keto-4-pentenoate hydratase
MHNTEQLTKITRTAEYLLANRFDQRVVDNIPETMYPSSTEEAYQVQDQVVEFLTEKYNSETCGYKLACTNKPIMKLLGVDGPFSGRLMSHSVYESGVVLNATDFVRRIVEQEFVFVVGEDVPYSKDPFTADSVKPYLSTCFPGIELVDHRYKDFSRVGGNALIADNAIHAASILGDSQEHWRTVDFPNHQVKLLVNDTIVSEGSGANVLGNPLNVMAWLANHLQSRGLTLKTGDIVTTGTACDVYNAEQGDKITADFGGLGSVSLSFV